MSQIIFERVCVEFPGTKKAPGKRALHSFDLRIDDQEFLCLLGPSGCGKSTALNVVAGFVQPTEGAVLVDGATVGGPGPDRGVVFQDANVFPWLTVERNVAFGPSLRGRQEGTADKVADMIARVGLTGFEQHLPLELSGGMRQRVGLARTLVNDPPTLLMDEPFGALDAQTRIIMQELLLELWQREQKTVLFVTHDIDEAILLGDRIAVMTAHPGTIKLTVTVPFPRPRTYDITSTPEFQALRGRLLDVLHAESERAEFELAERAS